MSSTSKGIPKELHTRIKRLADLLEGLPNSLPVLSPPEAYSFGLDADDVESEGLLYAFNRSLEITLKTHENPSFTFNQRGPCFDGLVAMIKKAAKELSPPDRDNPDGHLRRWLGRLIEAAEGVGAKVQRKKPAKRLIESSEEEEQPTPKENLWNRTKRARKLIKRAVINLVSSGEENSNSDSDEVTYVGSSHEVSAEAPANSSLPTAPEPASTGNRLTENSGKRARPTASSDSDGDGKRPALRQRTLFDLGCKRTTREEVARQVQRTTEILGVDKEKLREQESARKERQNEHRRQTDRLRQARWRARKREARGHGAGGNLSAGRKAKTVVLGSDLGYGVVASSLVSNLAKLSRPGMTWKDERNGKKNGVVAGEYSRINWFNPLLWSGIARIAPRVCFSPTLIVKHLQREHPALYKRLRKHVVSRWISKNKNGWSKKTKAKIELGASLKGSGRVGVLAQEPEIVEELKKKLEELRDSGITVDRILGRSILLTIIRDKKPDLLKEFKCGEKYVGHFYESVLKWSLRCGTRPAHKLPDDAIEQCERAFFRLVHLIHLYDIPLEMVVNMDQTGIILMMSKNRTFAPTGSRQVDISSHDEKRAYTLCVATTPAGDILPFQQVWSGKTKNSLPQPSALGYEEAIAAGFDFVVADSPKKTSHFSTFSSMTSWMKLFDRYFKDFIETNKDVLDLQPDQKGILLIDCYPVHIGAEFRMHVFKEYPNIFLLFIPAGCTGIFQAADVGLNRVLKHFLRQEALQFLVESHQAQLSEGLTPKQVKFTTSLPVLRNASVKPIVNLYNYFKGYSGRELIKKAWDKCTVKEFNLGGKCLKAKSSKIAYREYLEKDEVLRREIENKIGREGLLNATDLVAEEVCLDEVYDEGDGSEMPLSRVAEELADNPADVEDLVFHNTFCVEPSQVERELDGRLVSTNPVDSIWAYTTDGTTWSSTLDNCTSA